MAQTITRPHEGHGTAESDLDVVVRRYGILAEFDEPEPLMEAVKKARAAGYRKMDAFTPMPVEGLSDALGFKDFYVPWTMLIVGACGGTFAFSFLSWAMKFDYGHNIGGRPLWSWPMFIPITFEATVLSAALSGIFGMFIMNGLPRPHHPLFSVPAFDRASSSSFFLCIEADDPRFDAAEARSFLEGLGAKTVSDVNLETGEKIREG